LAWHGAFGSGRARLARPVQGVFGVVRCGMAGRARQARQGAVWPVSVRWGAARHGWLVMAWVVRFGLSGYGRRGVVR
jgi:hypothetical protein